MEVWKMPDKIKTLEALGAIFDNRIKIDEKNQSATCWSSDRAKQYTIRYDIRNSAITSDDNSSNWQGRLGYPSIAVLMMLGELPQDKAIGEALKNIPWKEINAKFKNDYTKTLGLVYEIVKPQGVKEKDLNHYMANVLELIEEKQFKKL
jgi:hypothetical protein